MLRPALAALFALTGATASAQDYQFPLHWEDLNPGERFFTSTHAEGIQTRGRDLGLWRHLGNGEWDWRSPTSTLPNRNETNLIYQRPFYAIADGEVIGCWRNAPENPSPPDVHEQRLNGFVAGGGNHLWIRQDDGVVVLYAHAVTGSIPAELCPRNTDLPADPFGPFAGHPDVDPKVFIPDGIAPDVATGTVVGGVTVERPRVRARQFLGRVGNSGASSGPHLHIHGETVDANFNSTGPAHLVYERGLFTHVLPNGTTPLTGNGSGLEFWNSFGDNTLPKGRILIWPPVPPAPQFTRHGLPLDEWPRMRQLLDESGYIPVALDCYRVGNETFVNVSFRTWSGGDWRAEIGLNEFNYQGLFDWATESDSPLSRWRPILVESCRGPDGPIYGAVFLKGDPLQNWAARHAMTLDEHEALLDEMRAIGFSPAAVSVVSIENRRRFTALYTADDRGATRMRTRMVQFGSIDQYQDEFEEAAAAGLTPIHLNAYIHNNRRTMVAIFAENAQQGVPALHGLDGAAFQQAFEENGGNGFVVRALTAFDGADALHVYAAVWEN